MPPKKPQRRKKASTNDLDQPVELPPTPEEENAAEKAAVAERSDEQALVTPPIPKPARENGVEEGTVEELVEDSEREDLEAREKNAQKGRSRLLPQEPPPPSARKRRRGA